MAPPNSLMASIDAVLADLYPWSSLAWTPSTTTMASSTTIAMASTMAERVSRLILNPISFSTKNVAINATGMAMAGINVERISCKKMYTTMNTRINASIKVLITSWIEANKKSLALCAILIFKPEGNVSEASSSTFSKSLMVCVALVPAIWYTIQDTALCPFTLLLKLYDRRPSSMSAMSFIRSTSPFSRALITMFSNSSGCWRRPL